MYLSSRSNQLAKSRPSPMSIAVLRTCFCCEHFSVVLGITMSCRDQVCSCATYSDGSSVPIVENN